MNTAGEHGTSVTSDRLADLIVSATAPIITNYEKALEISGSTLLRDTATREQCLQQAGCILTDLGRILRGEARFQGSLTALSAEIGTSRASRRIHPSESLRAAVVLFDAIMSTTTQLAEAAPISTTELAWLAVTANSVVSQRIRMAAGSYTGFLLARLNEAHTAEHRRISRELHDRICGNITAAHRQVELFRLRADQGDSATDCLDNAELALELTLSDLRALIADLRMSTPEKGLEKTLRAYADSIGLAASSYQLSVNGDEFGLPAEIRSEVFLIVREAIRNVTAHADASVLFVQVNITPNELYAFVEDDGNGFSPTAASSSRRAGLSSMRERAELLGGQVIVTSHPGCGTRVELLVPLDPDETGPSR